VHIQPETFAAVIRAYLASPTFARLAPSTQEGYRIYLKIAELPDVLGGLPVGTIRPALVQQFLDGLSERPGAQQRARVAIKAVEKFALPRDLLPFPITTGTEIVGSTGGHKPWTEAQVQCAERYARPDVARIVVLAANTGQRGSDLCRMTWADLEEVDGRLGINVTQRKTGLQIWIPLTVALQHAIDGWERRPTPILLKSNGKPFANRKQLSMAWERERDRNRNLWPCAGLVLHGLRATAVVRLRRAGATTVQIVDMVGLSAPMVERYSRFADQKQSALAAVYHLDRTGTEQELRKVTSKGDATS
jgi:integrase